MPRPTELTARGSHTPSKPVQSPNYIEERYKYTGTEPIAAPAAIYYIVIRYCRDMVTGGRPQPRGIREVRSAYMKACARRTGRALTLGAN
jgi:hypothetical protein